MRFQRQFRQSPHLDAKSPFCQDHSQQMFVMKTAWEDFTGSLSSMLQCLTVLIKNIFLKSHLNLLCWKASCFLSSSQMFTEQFITGLFIVTLYISKSCYHVSCSLCSRRLNKLYHFNPSFKGHVFQDCCHPCSHSLDCLQFVHSFIEVWAWKVGIDLQLRDD